MNVFEIQKKKYSDLGEEEKIRKKKSLYLYCVIQTFHPFDIKKSSIREKKNFKRVFRSGRRREDSREEQKLILLLRS